MCPEKTWKPENKSEILNILILIPSAIKLSKLLNSLSLDGNNNLKQLAIYGFTRKLFYDLVLMVNSFSSVFSREELMEK